MNKFIINEKANQFRINNYNCSIKEWNNWEWQIKNSFIENNIRFPTKITPYFKSVIENSVLSKTVIPSELENNIDEYENIDPLNENNDSPVDGIVHRYPDRVLFLVTNNCATFCRYCTRYRIICEKNKYQKWQNCINYIKSNKNIHDVLLSGGDPLTLKNNDIEWLLSNLHNIEHINFIRIGTKIPVVLPQRITIKLINILKKYHPLYMSLHFIHPDEITPETELACTRLANAGIPLGSQTVLLKNINDNPEIIKILIYKLLKIRVKPYYLFQCDLTNGTSHFRTPVQTGINIIESLRGHISGYGIPHFVVDGPCGSGKIPLLPNYVVGYENNFILIRNFKNNIYKYPLT